MTTTYRALFVSSHPASQAMVDRLVEGSDIAIGETATPAEVIASVARRAPDLIIIDVDSDAAAMTHVCDVLKANPATLLLPLLALAKSSRQRLPAFEAGVDDFLTHQVKREEFLIRVHALLRASAARRQLAAGLLADEVRQGEDIRAAFRRYISPKLADQIMASAQLRDAVFTGSQTRAHASVMFADMRGFTGISERLKPADVVGLLNEFFALLTDITFEYDGTVFNMAGDSLLVGFGVPVAQSDGATRATFAARRMLEKFGDLAQRWKVRHDVETGLGIGINIGEVIAGNIGSASYMNYTIIGDTVNVASRLAQRARAGEILFSDAVKQALDLVGVDIGALPLPSLILRGRSHPINIFCVPSVERIDFRIAP